MVVDHAMQFKAIAPATGGFATLRQTPKHTMVANAAIMPDRQRRRIHKREAGTRSVAGLHIGTEWANRVRQQLHEALIADGSGQLAAQMAKHVAEILGFEGAEPHVVDIDQNRHDVAHRQLSGATAPALTVRPQLLLPLGQKGLANGIDMPKKFQ